MKRLFPSAVFFLVPIAGQIVPGRYIVEMDAPRASENADVFRARNAEALIERGVQITDRFRTIVNGAAVSTDLSAEQLAALPGVKRVYRVAKRKPSMDRAAALHRALEAWQAAGGQGEAGRGVKIAIIDSGIEPDHPAFQDSSLSPPDGYPRFRRELDADVLNAKIIVARSYDDLLGTIRPTGAHDRMGHGTAVAMAAAGVPVRGNYAQLSGIAPKAFLGVYRVFSYDSDSAFDDIIVRAVEDAIADGMDIINLSLGGVFSERGTDDLYDALFRRASEAGVIVVAAAGNEGPQSMTADAPGYSTHAISAGASSSDRTFRFPVTIPGVLTAYGVPGSGPNSPDTLSGALADVETLDGTGLACSPLPPDSLTGKIAFILRGDCLFEAKIVNASGAGAVAALIYTNTPSPPIAMSVHGAKLPAIMVSNATGRAIRTALADQPSLTASIGFNGESVALESRQIVQFSARGPSPYGGVKPDVAAMGSPVYTAAQTVNEEGVLYDGSGFRMTQGTSFSSPIVAGAAAVVRAKRPGLTAGQYRSLIVNTASAFTSADGVEFGPLEAGAGLLNVEAALKSNIALSAVSVNFGAFPDGNVQANRDIAIHNLGADADELKVEVVSANPSHLAPSVPAAVSLQGGSTVPFKIELASSSLPAGVYEGVVKVTSSLTGSILRLPYWFAVPSKRGAQLRTFAQDPENPRPGQTVEVYLRIIDSTGVPIVEVPTVRALTPDLEVLEIASADHVVAGALLLRVKLPNSIGVSRAMIESGEFQREVSFRATSGN